MRTTRLSYLLFSTALLLVGYNSVASAQTGSLNLVSTTANPGATVAVGVNLTVSGTAPASLSGL